MISRVEKESYFPDTHFVQLDGVPEEAATAPPGSSSFIDPFYAHRGGGARSSNLKSGRKGAHRNYPRSKDNDDKDERIGLVDQAANQADSDSTGPSDSESTPVDHPGIRLVSTKNVI